MEKLLQKDDQQYIKPILITLLESKPLACKH